MRRNYLLSYLLLTTFFVSALYARPSADEIDPQYLIVPQISTSKKDVSFFRKEYPTLESVIQLQDSLARGSKSVAFRAGSSRDLSQYAVGSIPIQESVSPSGARIYNIPIATAQGWNLTPSISLVYNSQAGNNVAGYGWSIGGLSAITVRNSNIFYDGVAQGGVYDSTSAKYILDGNPLVTSDAGVSDYTLATARGNVLVSKHTNASGQVRYFTVLYPDGSTATFGFTTNWYPQSSYPISLLTDKDGNTIHFYYTQTGNYYYINSITYGNGARIDFTYSSRSDVAPYQYSSYGQSLPFPQKLLSGITSRDGSETICEYLLSHEYSDGVSLLSEVRCLSGGEDLPPLEFSYGDGNLYPDNPHFDTTAEEIFNLHFTKSDSLRLEYHRGKLIPCNPNDGIVVLPALSTYTQVDRKWVIFHGYCYKYGSAYDPQQDILCNVTAYNFSQQRNIKAEAGFQTIEAVDIDGDGTDELVKINSSSSSQDVTTYKITVYSFDTSFDYSATSFTVSVSDGTHNAAFNNPAKSFYRFGNFRGDGKTMLLIMTKPHSKFALIDLNAGVKISENSLFTIDEEYNNLVITADFENDGKTDLCHISDSGMDVYSLSDASSTSFSLRTTYSGLTRDLLYRDTAFGRSGPVSKARLYTVDLNADGYLDIASAPDEHLETPTLVHHPSRWNFARFNGKQFSIDTTFVKTRKPDDSIVFLDVDKDGLPDILHIQDSLLYYCPNDNGRFSEYNNYSGVTINASSDLIPGDCSLYGTSGIIAVMSGPWTRLYEFSLDHTSRRSLTRMTDSFGIIHTNTYRRTGGYTGAYLMDPGRSYSAASGYSRLRASLNVLYCSADYSASFQPITNTSYTYWDAVYHTRGLGFCGFGKIRTMDYISNDETITILDPEKFGVPTSVSVSKVARNAPYSTVTNTYDSHSTTYGKLNPRLTQSISVDSLTGTTSQTWYTYGAYDLPSTIIRSSRLQGGIGQRTRTELTYSNSISPALYLIGSVLEESSISENDGDQLHSWVERKVNTYDASFHPLTSRQYVGIDSATNLVSTTRRTYNSHGNVTSEKTAPYSATEFVGDTLIYDSNSRYLVGKTDALGHSTTYSGYNKFGKPTSVTDYRGRTTSFTYDSWGNLIGTSYADGGSEQTTATWGGDGLYTVTHTETGSPETVIHYDALGREVKSGVKRFDGQWQFTDKEYDARGRLSRVSLPYRGSSSAYWNAYYYDDYDRPDSLVEASGRVTRWSYSGTSTTTVKDGVTTTVTTDALGRTVSVSDAGGTVTYNLRDDGQPSSVVAPGNIVTTFTYDDYGRRTQMVDPSLGTETDSFVWNSDGSSSTTHTNRNGTVTTYKDKYGRTTSVVRAGEFNTTYSYDTYGRLSSVSSTNSTGKQYTYDAYDRIATLKETVPDGKWLQKTYSYSAGSVLSSIAYTSQSGYITTENYTYANGHNTGITVPSSVGGGQLTVWSLVSENDLGQPTEITTGGFNRQYGFTAFGLPTYRKMDDGYIQNYSYQFDPLTGNLLSRTDEFFHRTESFTYDNLNRLTGITQGGVTRQIVYSDNGNINSIGGVGTLIYGGGEGVSPYEVTGLTPEAGQPTYRQRSVTYNSFDRPASISEGTYLSYLEYSAGGERVKMAVRDTLNTHLLIRYYIGSRYEYDINPAGGVIQKLYIGGDAYSAPMVWIKDDLGKNGFYNIGRDYQGSITEITDTGGSGYMVHNRYDPWGRPVNPSTGNLYPNDNWPYLSLGRGYTGHEILPWFGLINANARLYDPLLGRFLSPDPYVQDPDNPQNFNRYSYCLNNPLRYTDESGEFVITTTIAVIIAGATIGAVVGMYQGYKIGESKGAGGWAMAGYMLGGGIIGGVAGLASGVVGLAAAPAVASAGLGGFIGGAVTGGLTGAAAGWINGLGFGLLSTGSISSSLKSAGIGLLSGTLIGAFMGGTIEGVSAAIKGKDFWTGNLKIKAQTNHHNPLSSPKNEIEIPPIESPRAVDNVPNEYSIRWETENNGTLRMDDLSPKLLSKRPEIIGYNKSLTSGNTYHEFPRYFDEYIVKYGASYSRLSDGSTFFTMTGSINGQNGVYTIGINDSGIIYHRCFFPRK